MRHYGLPLIFLFLSFVQLSFAQNEKVNGNGSDSDACANLPVDQFIVVGDIILKGNNRTRDRILMREIEFKSGDTLSYFDFCRLKTKSRQNLLNSSLFNFVDFDTIQNPQLVEIKDVEISVIERWYIWPLPIFELAERNFNTWWQTKDFRKANYGVFLTYNNFRGRNEVLKVLLRAGYNQNYFLLYEIPSINRKQNFGMGFLLGHSQSREIPYITESNKQIFYRHQDGYARSQWYGSVQLNFRRGIHNNHNLTIGYEAYRFADTILTLNPDFLKNENASLSLFQFNYKFRHDYRDSKPYPLNGHYFDAEINKRGFNILKDEPNYFTLKTTFDLYRPIRKRLYWAMSLSTKVSAGEPEPYFLQRGLGYNNEFVRSYELFVADGSAYGLLKSNIKYTLIEPRSGQLPYIKFDKFGKIHYAAYLNLIFDAGYVHNTLAGPTNNYQNRMLYGTGLGLDLVTYYDLVWRFEYSVNQFGNAGFFIHFVAPI
jgi:outer membrane protein assembly factor BamA